MKISVHGPRGVDDGDLGTGPVQISTPGAGGARARAAVALAGGAPFLQPLEGEDSVFLNDHRLAASQWLSNGDRARIGDAVLTVRVTRDGLVLESGADLAFVTPALAPPLTPPAAIPVSRRRHISGSYVLLALAILASVLWFVFAARMLYVDVQPEPDRISLEGTIPAIRIRDSYLGLPGVYRLTAERGGYLRLVREVEITHATSQRVAVTLAKLPGYLSVDTPGITGATVLAGGTVVGHTPLADIELAAGEHPIVVRADGYADFSQAIQIEGLGHRQTLTAALARAAASVSVQSSTAGAVLWVDGSQLGSLPVTADLAAGAHVIEIRASGHKSWRQSIVVKPGQPQAIGPIALAPAGAQLRVASEPAGASVALDGQYAGTTPTTLVLNPGREHRVTFSKQGYATATRSVRLERSEERDLSVTLSSEVGQVTIEVQPQDAVLTIEGRAIGPANGRHALAAAPTLLEISRDGYAPAQLWVTPKPGFEQTLSVKLRGAGAAATADAAPERLTAPDGTVMVPVKPGKFTMGASRREPGQRANEALREVQLSRAYYLGATEVTNAQFQKYRPQHRSGKYGSVGLEGSSHPVVNVRWEDAAGYCNWLNEAARLPASYTGSPGSLAPAQPLRHGFRLPTEAEWEWAARRAGVEKESRFPWGDDMPPAPRSGNFADRSISGELADTIKDYDDGHAGTAPVGSFRASPAGFFDLAGNAAEWVHDYYDIRTASLPEKDPTGPAGGKQHVIRGSSWMQSSITALRWTFRDYGTEPRPDVGFRCARYATETP